MEAHEGTYSRVPEQSRRISMGNHTLFRLLEDVEGHGVTQKATHGRFIQIGLPSNFVVGYRTSRRNHAGNVEAADHLQTYKVVTL